MISHLDKLLRHLIKTQITDLGADTQFRFQPPDYDLRTYVNGQSLNIINIYLVDLRENRKLRTNEWLRKYENGTAIDTPVPSLMDCHYLITAWSPAMVTPGIEPAIDEHDLLYKVAAVLTRNSPLTPYRIYSGSPELASVPELIRNDELPTQVMPVEGFPKLAEFWSTMGINHRWKPAIYLVVTIPVELKEEVEGPMVTTLITENQLMDSFGPPETFIQIGGFVFHAGKAVVNAWVELANDSGIRLNTTETDPEGRFQFENLHPGTYRLQSRSSLGVSDPRIVQVPSPTGEYNLVLK